MAGARQENRKRNEWLIQALWMAGVGLFVVELSAGLDYVEAGVSAQAPNFLGWLPALGISMWKIAEQALWNLGVLENVFRIMPMLALPFILVGLGLVLRRQPRIQAAKVRINEED